MRTFRCRRDYKAQARECLREHRRRLKAMLKYPEWTVRAVARDVGTTHGTIWRFAHGKSIQAETVLAIELWLDAQADSEAS